MVLRNEAENCAHARDYAVDHEPYEPVGSARFVECAFREGGNGRDKRSVIRWVGFFAYSFDRFKSCVVVLNSRCFFGGFKRFGAQVHEEGFEWCGVSAANGKLTITVQPNPSTESRECIVDAYVTNSSSPADDEKLIMPITVFQEGGDGTVAANNLTDLWGTWVYRYNQHDWDLDYAVTFGKDGSYYYVCTDNKNPAESFTRTGTYKVLSHEPWSNPSADGVIGLAEIEESFHNSLTGNDVVRQWTITLYNNGQLGYENKLWRAAK